MGLSRRFGDTYHESKRDLSLSCGGANNAFLLLLAQWRLDCVKEVIGDRVTFEDVWDVSIEAQFCVLVRKKLDIWKVDSEDWRIRQTVPIANHEDVVHLLG